MILLAPSPARQAEGSIVGYRKTLVCQPGTFLSSFFFKYVIPGKHDRICFTSLLSGSNPSGFVRSVVCNNCTHPRWLLKTLWNAICQACVQQAACHSATRKEEAGPASILSHPAGPVELVSLAQAQPVLGEDSGVDLLLAHNLERFCLGNKPRRVYPSLLLPLPLRGHGKHIYLQGKVVSLLVSFSLLRCSMVEVLDYFRPLQETKIQGWLLSLKDIWQIGSENWSKINGGAKMATEQAEQHWVWSRRVDSTQRIFCLVSFSHLCWAGGINDWNFGMEAVCESGRLEQIEDRSRHSVSQRFSAYAAVGFPSRT